MAKVKKSEKSWTLKFGGYEFNCIYESRKKVLTVFCALLLPSNKSAVIGGAERHTLASLLATELIQEGRNLADGSKAEIKV